MHRLSFDLDLLNGDRYNLAVDVPLFGVGEGLAEEKLGAEGFVKNLCLVALGDSRNGVVACEGNLDVIHNLEAGVLTHSLDLGDDLADVALLDKLGSEVLIDNHGDALIGKGLEALLLCHLDEEILFCEDDLCALNGEGDVAVCLKLGVSRVAVKLGETSGKLKLFAHADGLECATVGVDI